MGKIALSTILLALLFLPSFSLAGAHDAKRVIIIVANGLSLEDIQQLKQQGNQAWIDRGRLAAMNLRTAGDSTDVNNLVTMNSGNRAVAVDKAVEAYGGWELLNQTSVKDFYQQLTGKKGSDKELYIPSYSLITSVNSGLSYSAKPGLLGDVLHQQGLSTAAIGKSDKGSNSIVRFAPLLVSDSNGIVDQGNLGEVTLRSDKDHVYGIATNYDYLLSYIAHEKTASVIAVELGDLYRLYSLKRVMEADHFSQMKTQVLQEISQFMDRLLQIEQPGDLVCLVSPMVNAEAQAKRSLMSPFLMYTYGQQPGILTSTTTHQPGIVANLDLAPTILQWLNVPVPTHMIGRVMVADGGENDFWNRWEGIKHIYSSRGQVLYGYVSFQIAVLIIATSLYFFANPSNKFYRLANLFVRFLMLVITLSPFLFLILPLLLPIASASWTIIFVLLLGTALSAGLAQLPFAWIFCLISLVNWIPILFDGVFAHSFLMKQSYLGYDAVIGARYYGIGNEYMGVVIGSSILTIAMLLEIMRREGRLIKGFSIVVFGVFLVYFAWPDGGTNAGGAITAVAAYMISFFRLFAIELNRRYLFWSCMIVLISIGTLFVVNMTAEVQVQSHIGRAMHMLFDGDLREIWNISERKLSMNWHLIQVSSWSKVFITSLLVLGLLCYRPKGMIARLSVKYPYAVRGFFGIIVGAFTALLVNDSGIVAAATTIIFMVVPLVYLGLEEKMG